MTKLSVNVNKIATLRNTRSIGIPSVAKFSRIALEAGAHGITIHPRPDERHIRKADVGEIARVVREFPAAEFNIEGNPFFEFERFADETRPSQVTLVPDTLEASTSDHGWDLLRDADRLRPIVTRLKEMGCRVSLFMDPDPALMQGAKDVGADRVELYTAPYAEDFLKDPATAARSYAAAAKRATELGLRVNAGHDLSLQNLPRFIKEVANVAEVSIGHALIADALEFGLAETVRKYLAACR